MTARKILEVATLGGASVLGQNDIDSPKVGNCADFFTISLHTVDYAIALHDPVAATMFCAPQKAHYTVVNGQVIVDQGRLATVDLPILVERHNAASFQLTDIAENG